MNDQQHSVDVIFASLDCFGSYPAGVIPTKARIAGTAFFPGGSGLWQEPGDPPRTPTLPVGGVMVLGHNFDTPEGYAKSLKAGKERLNGATWGPLVTLLPDWGISLEQCFFTNAYMGLKDNNGKSTGPFPGARDADFLQRCREFLRLQIRTQQPHLLLTLGKEVPPILAPLAPELRLVWSDRVGKVRLPELDTAKSALMYPVQFPGVPHPTAVVALTHPYFRNRNVCCRQYGELEGDAAERALVREAISLIGGLHPNSTPEVTIQPN